MINEYLLGAGWSLGRSNAPRGSSRSKCQVKALLHGKINEAFDGQLVFWSSSLLDGGSGGQRRYR